jgi:tRNA (guanine37-N1)-methyltransferase
VKINIVTLFPEYFASIVGISLVAKAIAGGQLEIEYHDPRDHSKGAHRQVDDAPYGGGAGMVMMIDPLAKVLEPLEASHRILFAPSGQRLDQNMLDRFADVDEITLVCGRYEGIDERVVDHFIDEEVSLGDFVLLGGEVAAATVLEGVARLLPGVVGNPESTVNESFRDGMLEEPHYTRPADYRGWKVPDVLLSGDHGRIEQWRQDQRTARTAKRRPDLLEE